MSSSADDNLPSHEVNDHLLESSSYPLKAVNGRTPRYRDGIEDAYTGHISPSLSLDEPENRVSQVYEEGFLTERPNPICSLYGGPKESAARVFHALCRWVKGPRPPRPFKIKPILPQLQNLPLAFLHKHFPGRRQRIWLLIIFYFLWGGVFLGVLSMSISGCQVPGYKTPVRLSCVSRFW